MSFNRACSYTCLAYMIEDFALDYSDSDIVIEMKLAYLFFNDSKSNYYYSGAMLQGKKWFDLFLNRHHLDFRENIIQKEDIIKYIRDSSKKLMIGLNLDLGKHAMVYCPTLTEVYRFMNPHYKDDGESDYIVYTEKQLLEKLDDEVSVGYVIYDTNIQGSDEHIYYESKYYLGKYIADFVEFCETERTMDEINNRREGLFSPLLLTIIPLLELEEEKEIVSCLLILQKDYIRGIQTKTKKIRLSDYINLLLVNNCVRRLKVAIENNIPPFVD